jgi:tetratricopeptide (TPR) repeat protein
MDAYNAGRFQEAIDLLDEAYRLSPVPVVLYDLARAYEGLGNIEQAARYYRAFLAADPNADDRGAIEGRIATLEAQLRERERAQAAARAQRLASDRTPSVVPWVVTGVGGAVLVTGVVLGLLAQSKSAGENGASQVVARQDNADAKSFATGANVAFVVGGTLAVAGLVWVFLDRRASQKAALPPSTVVARWASTCGGLGIPF